MTALAVTRRVTFLLALVTFCAASTFGDARVKSVVLASGAPELVLDLPDRNRLIEIINFVQDANAATAGEISVTRAGKSVTVLLAALPEVDSALNSETQKDIVVVGPAQITVKPSVGASVFLSYRLKDH